MLTWNEIKKGSPDRKYSRIPEDQYSYSKHLELKKEQFGNIETYLKILNTDIFEDVVFTKNKFPYFCSPNIRHYVAWITSGKDFTSFQIETLASISFPGSKIVAWENELYNRSVNMKHFHVFVKYTKN